KDVLVLNSDMFNATTDAPKQMNFYQMGRKSVLMNISDLVVKGVRPKGIIISLGLPPELLVSEFKELIRGIIEYSNKWNLQYLGGDLNKSKEIIINPTVFGFKNPKKIIYRNGIKEGDILVVNSKYGLTSVGFDILLNRKERAEEYSKYNRSIMSVLEPKISEVESYLLSDRGLASASIDSSDGLVKSLRDLMLSNKSIGFEIEFDENLIDSEAIKYSVEFNILLKRLVVNGGEEFIHIFTIHPKDYEEAVILVNSHGGTLIKVGKAISEERVFLWNKGKREELKNHGYQHFE
ncbi:MAG: thiamine-monophosphate kinase, partial [Candidatus Hermodarchaeota archaeon]